MTRRFPTTVWILMILAVVGCGSETTAPPASIAGKVAAVGDSELRTGEGRIAAPASPDQGAPRDPNHPVVAIETSAGTIEVELDRERAPLTVYHILDLATSGQFRDTLVHYVEEGRMIVCGGYQVDRKPCAPVAAVRNEADNGLKNIRGSVAMSRPPDSIDGATWTFFINLADAPQLDHRGEQAADFGYCVFGHVIGGLEVAERIAAVETIPGEFAGNTIVTPATPIVIKEMRQVR